MNNIFKVSKYQMRDIRKGFIIFYTIIFAISITSVIVSSSLQGNVSFEGFGISTAIFIFITGLNCFKGNFKFLHINNVSRKRFYVANIITLATVSAIMALIDIILSNILNLMVSYSDIFNEFYRTNSIFANFLWSFTFFVFLAYLGWFITMIYYRCDKLMKTIVSLSPVFLIIIITFINSITDIGLWGKIVNIFGRILGLSDGSKPYIAVMSFVIGSVGVLLLDNLLIRKIPIRD